MVTCSNKWDMLLEQMVENVKHEIELIYSKKKLLSKDLFLLCPNCKKRIIQSIIEKIYCLSENKCQECKPLIQKSTAEVVKLFEELNLDKDMPLQQFFKNGFNKKTLISILNGIFTIGPKIPCTFPQTCSFELTHRCNLKCKHCYIGTTPNTDEMNTKTVFQIIKDIAEAGFGRIPLSGGEPLLRNDILLIMKEIKNYDMEVILSTNGTLLSATKVRELKPYIDLVCISLDSHKESVHDNFRGMDGAQKATLKGIRNCLANDLPVRIFTTLTKYNYNNLPEFINFIKKLGIREITLFDLNLVGKGSQIGSEVQLSIDEFKKVVNILIDLTKLNNIKIDVLAPFNFRNNAEYLNKNTLLSGGFCNAGINTLNISSDGYIQPCSRLRINLGNVKTEKIKEIWTNSAILKDLRDRTRLKGMCGKCKYKYFCGGCRANAYSLYEDYLMEDFRCI